jgi:hypothetical protein
VDPVPEPLLFFLDLPSDNITRRWLQHFQETVSVLHWKRAGNQALHMKILIEHSKRFLEANKNQLDKLLCS